MHVSGHLPLKEPLAYVVELQLVNHGNARQLVLLIGDMEHFDQDFKCTVDRGVCRSLFPLFLDILNDVILDVNELFLRKPAIKIFETLARLLHILVTRHLIVFDQIPFRFVIDDPIEPP